jgi:hypothetical protein
MRLAAASPSLDLAWHQPHTTTGSVRHVCRSRPPATAGCSDSFEGYLDDFELLNASRFPDPATVNIRPA